NIDSRFTGAVSVVSADIDNDFNHYIDVVGAAYDLNTISWFENTDGDGSAWTEHIVDSDFKEAKAVTVADINGDGHLDIIGAAFDEIAWWPNDGSGGFGAREPIGTVSGPNSVAAFNIDLDVFHIDPVSEIPIEDTDMDILITTSEGGVIWYENENGDGSSWARHNVETGFDGASSATAAKLDGDDDYDIIGTAAGDGRVYWWENKPGYYGFAGIYLVENPETMNVTIGPDAQISGYMLPNHPGVLEFNDNQTLKEAYTIGSNRARFNMTAFGTETSPGGPYTIKMEMTTVINANNNYDFESGIWSYYYQSGGAWFPRSLPGFGSSGSITGYRTKADISWYDKPVQTNL
ncbi:MAG: VCBS repeat-containing protein, partial [Planctomycetes bacterium]|nr:VCBS repeat-containing protein [Planctomycetota bacterium]